LSDYTQMINQVSVVSTLTLGMTTAAFGSLLGNTDNQPEWKSVMFSISCVITVCLSILSVIESFFLGVHINQVEARFAGGIYPHINTNKLRIFNTEELKNLNAKFNFVVITFFGSFLSFSTTILSTMYIGLGLSNNVFEKDVRLVKKGDLFINDPRFNRTTDTTPLYNVEPNYIRTATIMTVIVGFTYFIILFRFFLTYSNHIYGKSLLRFLIICGCMRPKGIQENEDLLTPIETAAERFNSLQLFLKKRCVKWEISSANLIVFIIEISKNQLSIFKQNTLPKEYSIDTNVPNEDDQNYFRITISKLSSITNSIFDTLEDAALTSKDIWTNAPKMEKLYACKNKIAKLKTNIDVIQKYQLSERAEPLTKFSYEIQPWGRLITFLILLWGISGGVVITILLFLLGILFILTLNLCSCFKGKIYGIELDSSRGIRKLTTSHFECLYRLYKKQVNIEQSNYSIRKRSKENHPGVGEKIEWIDHPIYHDDISILKF